jgi:hypothetical protein
MNAPIQRKKPRTFCDDTNEGRFGCATSDLVVSAADIDETVPKTERPMS